MNPVVEGFRNPELAQTLVKKLHERARHLDRTLTFMEVCGTHTMAIHRFGIKSILPASIRLISGPGCPVCVSPNRFLDHAIAILQQPDVILCTFGDMLRVPGSYSSLQQERANRADVRIVYSPLDAVRIAKENPLKRVIFLGVGFETTIPTIAGAIHEAQRLALTNFLVLTSLKTIPEAMRVLASDPEIAVNGFLCPAHVSAIIGVKPYEFLAREYHLPCVIAGFEGIDILYGLIGLVEQCLEHQATVVNQYSRVVRYEGNMKAQALIAETFEPEDGEWRGIGVIPGSGLKCRETYAMYDAWQAYRDLSVHTKEQTSCHCGSILKGIEIPPDCPLFNKGCSPEHPIGPCMVSSEGACAAYYKYSRTEVRTHE